MIGKTNSQIGSSIKGEKLNISLMTNQSSHSDLMGAIITVTHPGGATNYTWEGSEITVDVPPYVNYSVAYSAVNGYKTPVTFTSTAVADNSRTITGTYQTEIVTVTASADDSTSVNGVTVTINGTDYTWAGTAISVKIPYDTTYTVSVSDKDGYTTPASQTFTASQSGRNLSLQYVYNPYKITTIRIRQTIADPDGMITRIVDEGGVEAIRANSHRYVGMVSSGIMQLKQLDDSNSTLFIDGTDASEYINGYNSGVVPFASSEPTDTNAMDVWMKLPQFYWKCTQYTTDQWDFSVAYGGKPDDTYNEWDGKDLIGVYEAFNDSDYLCSISGKESSGSISQADFKTYARNRGDGYTLVKWKHHCMMAMLFYTYYGTTNSQAVCGSGTNSSTKTTGATNTLGMTDTTTSNGNSMSINFWGLENWWGNKYEWIDNVVVDALVWTITEDDGTTRTAGTGGSSDGWITKLLLGENIDMIPTAVGASESTGYCDYYYQSSNNTRVVRRSYSYSDTSGGVAFANANSGSSNTGSVSGSRLAFRGDYEIA